MIASVILSLMMAGIIFFFVIACQNFSVFSILYGIFLLYLYARMTFAENIEKGSGVKYRRIFQVVFCVFFCISFVGNLLDERGSMSITQDAMANGELPFCHIAIPQALLPFILTKNIIFPARIWGHYASVSSMLVIWLTVVLFIGRGWCSWVCFYGGWEEGFSHVGKKKKLNLLSKNKEIREFQFGFFAFVVLCSLGTLSAIYCEWYCPFKLLTEFTPITSIPTLIQAVIFIGLFLSLVVVFPILTKRRTQCSALCPFGAFASLTDKISMFKIQIDTDKCKGCLKCALACPFGAIDIKTIQEKKSVPELTCAKCGECIGVCPEKAISYSFRRVKKCGNKVPTTKVGKALAPLLDPANLFRFSAYTFGVIMSGSFVVDSLKRIASLFF